MLWFLSVLKRGTPGLEDWLDRRLLSSGKFVSRTNRELIFEVDDTQPLKVLNVPAVVFVQDKEQKQHYYFHCTSFELEEANTLHLYGEAL